MKIITGGTIQFVSPDVVGQISRGKDKQNFTQLQQVCGSKGFVQKFKVSLNAKWKWSGTVKICIISSGRAQDLEICPAFLGTIRQI